MLDVLCYGGSLMYKMIRNIISDHSGTPRGRHLLNIKTRNQQTNEIQWLRTCIIYVLVWGRKIKNGIEQNDK